jgi:ABC-type transport system substrate-binding protein
MLETATNAETTEEYAALQTSSQSPHRYRVVYGPFGGYGCFPVHAATVSRVYPIAPALAAIASQGGFPQAGVDGVPAEVEQLTVAFDGCGGDVIDPWQYFGTGMLQSYLNLRFLHRDQQMQVVPLWATAWRQVNEGIYFPLNPKAKWQDGTPATAEDLKANVEALMGKYAPAFKGTPRIGQFKRVVHEVQIIDPHHVLIKTEMPDPSFFSLVSGANYHQVWFGPSEYLKKGGHEGYIKRPRHSGDLS